MTQEAAGSIFGETLEVHLEKHYADPDGDWPMYVSDIKLAGQSERSVVNGIYIHRSWLPTPPPEKLRLKFEPV